MKVGRAICAAASTAVLLVTTLMTGATTAGATSASSSGAAPIVKSLNGVRGVFVSTTYQAAHPDYLARLTSSGSAASTGSRSRPATVKMPNSHYGCSRSVCINVVGSGTHVTRWSTDVVGDYGCIKAFFDMRHGQASAYRTVWGPQLCSNGQSGTYVSDYSPMPGDWPSGDQLCNGWIRGVVGYACATIHS